jgi:predicted transcriptional regulator
MTTTGIKLDSDIKSRLKELGDKMDRSPHWLMKQAIEQYVEAQERYWQQREEDEQRWQNYLLTGDAVSQEDAFAWLDSIGEAEEKPCPR